MEGSIIGSCWCMSTVPDILATKKRILKGSVQNRSCNNGPDEQMGHIASHMYTVMKMCA